ncbi:MAG: hypothetical protein RLZZ127_476 [Planctomycetota bacterium]|jgi:flagellar biosynthesis/type III secretory pathway protein FliH
MASVFDLAKAKGKAKGYAEGYAESYAEGYAEGYAVGYAEGIAEMTVTLAHDGVITRSVAERQLHRFHDQGAIPAELLAKALADLG